jgi:hypothetical protein
MSDTIVYALRHVATGLCMPQLNGAGYSYWEPTRDDHSTSHPRLFFTKRSAQNARSSWAQGCWKRDQGVSYDWEGVLDAHDDTYTTDPTVPRALADLELVALKLTEMASHA